MKDEDLFKKYMALLGEIFDKEITTILIDVYWKVLEPFNDRECERTFQRILATSRFFPKPADFLDHLEGNLNDKALIAWAKVSYAIQHVGPYETVTFDDLVIHSVIEAMGGWVEMQEPNRFHPTWSQKEFISIYKFAINARNHPVKCPGIYENQNEAWPDSIKEPMKIGHNKAGRIYALRMSAEEKKLLKVGNEK